MAKAAHSPQKIADLLTPKESQVLIRSLRAKLVSGMEGYDGLVGSLVNFPVFLDVPKDWEQRLTELPAQELPARHETYLGLSKDFLDEVVQTLTAEMKAWEGKFTDFDRLQCSILEMRTKGVDIWVFDDWGSIDSDDEMVGEALIPYEIAEDFDLQEVEIQFYVRSFSGQVTEATQIIVDKLESYGLNPQWDEDATEPVRGPISVRMMWQPHSILKEGWDELYETPEEYLASLAAPANQKLSDGDVD